MINFYLIYMPNQKGSRWEAMSDVSVPDPGAFPNHWYKKYEITLEKQEELFHKLIIIRDNMNKIGLLPTKEGNIFPKLADILKST